MTAFTAALVLIAAGSPASAREVPPIFVEAQGASHGECEISGDDLVKRAQATLVQIKVRPGTEAQAGEANALRMSIQTDVIQPMDGDGNPTAARCYASVSVRLYFFARVPNPVTKESLVTKLTYCDRRHLIETSTINFQGGVLKAAASNVNDCVVEYLRAF